MNLQQIRNIEEITMNAWPALQTFHYDGWIIRFANGVTKRSNSVYPIYYSNEKTENKIEFCEKLFCSADLPATFKIAGISNPPDLDKILEEKGYRRQSETFVFIMKLNETLSAIDKNIEYSFETDNIWLEHFVRMNNINISQIPVYKKIIDQILLPKSLFTLTDNDKIMGCGLGVIEGKYIGLFDIVIDKDYRKLGYGQYLVSNILKWGKQNGARSSWFARSPFRRKLLWSVSRKTRSARPMAAFHTGSCSKRSYFTAVLLQI